MVRPPDELYILTLPVVMHDPNNLSGKIVQGKGLHPAFLLFNSRRFHQEKRELRDLVRIQIIDIQLH